MRPARRLTARWAALTGTGAAASVSLGLLVFFCVFVAVAGPRDSLGLRTHAFRQVLSTAPVTARSVAATLDFATFASALNGQVAVSDLTAARDELGANLAKARVPLARGASWAGLASGYAQVAGAGPRVRNGCAPPEIEIIYRDRLSHYTRLVSGRLPGAPPSGQPASLPVAVTPATAARFGL